MSITRASGMILIQDFLHGVLKGFSKLQNGIDKLSIEFSGVWNDFIKFYLQLIVKLAICRNNIPTRSVSEPTVAQQLLSPAALPQLPAGRTMYCWEHQSSFPVRHVSSCLHELVGTIRLASLSRFLLKPKFPPLFTYNLIPISKPQKQTNEIKRVLNISLTLKHENLDATVKFYKYLRKLTCC